MSSWIIRIFILIFISFLSFVIGLSIRTKKENIGKRTVFDAKQDYLDAFHVFLNREYTYEIHQRFSNIIYILGSDNNTTVALQKLADTEELRLMISGMTTNIVSRMSDDIKNAFYRIYKRDEQVFIDYITRWLFFKIRSLITKINIQIQQNSEIKDANYRLSVNDIADKLMLELELNVYEEHGVEKIKLDEE